MLNQSFEGFVFILGTLRVLITPWGKCEYVYKGQLIFSGCDNNLGKNNLQGILNLIDESSNSSLLLSAIFQTKNQCLKQVKII